MQYYDYFVRELAISQNGTTSVVLSFNGQCIYHYRLEWKLYSASIWNIEDWIIPQNTSIGPACPGCTWLPLFYDTVTLGGLLPNTRYSWRITSYPDWFEVGYYGDAPIGTEIDVNTSTTAVDFTTLKLDCTQQPQINTLISSNITTTGQLVSFNLYDNTRYNIKWKKQTDETYTQESGIIQGTGTGKTFTITQLLPNTDYDWYVIQDYVNINCNMSTSDTLTNLKSFKTAATSCVTPTILQANMSTSSITADSQSANFRLTNTTEYYVKWRIGTNTWDSSSLQTGQGNITYTMTNLVSGTVYNWYIVQWNKDPGVCSEVTQDSSKINFTTLMANCSTPTITNLLSSNISQTTQVLTFNLTNFTKYKIFWKISSANSYSNSGDRTGSNSSITYNLSTLVQNTTYQWYITQDNTSSTCNTQTATTINNISDFTTQGLNSCNTPIISFGNTHTTNIAINSQIANFQLSNTSEYYVKFREENGDWNNSLLLTGSGNKSYTITSLIGGTIYEWYIEQWNKNTGVCNDITQDSQVKKFTTLMANCSTPAITNLLSSNISQTAQTLTFNLTNYTKYTIFWKEQTANSYSNSGDQTGSTNNISYDVTSLVQNKSYLWYVVQDNIYSTCNTQTATTIATLKNFTTQVLSNCDTPTVTLISSDLITTSSQKISFTLSNTTSYEVGYKVKSVSTSYIYSSPIIGQGAKTYVFTNLSSNVTYRFRIKQTNQTTNCTAIIYVTPETYEFKTLEDVLSCDSPEFQSLSCTDNTTTSFKVNYSIKKQTDYSILIKSSGQNTFSSYFSENITYSTSYSQKSKIISDLIPQTNYEWKIQQNNSSANCNQSIASSASTNTSTTNCNSITSKPVISFPNSNTIVYQNDEIEILWNPPSTGTNILYNLYIDEGTHVNITDISDVKYLYTFLLAKNYTLQVGQFNTCTTESTTTKSTIVTITVTNKPADIDDCPVPVITLLTTTNPTETTFDISYTISDSTTHVIKYKKVSESNSYWINFIGNTMNNGNHNYTITNLVPDTEYQWKIIQTNTSVS